MLDVPSKEGLGVTSELEASARKAATSSQGSERNNSSGTCTPKNTGDSRLCCGDALADEQLRYTK